MRGFGEKNVTAKEQCKLNKDDKNCRQAKRWQSERSPSKTSARDEHKLLFYFFMFYGKVFACRWCVLQHSGTFIANGFDCAMEVINSMFFSRSTISLYVGHFRIESRRVCNINNVQIVSDFHPCYKSSLAKCALAQSPTKRHHTYSHNASVNAQCIDCMWCGGGWLLHGK